MSVVNNGKHACTNKCKMNSDSCTVFLYSAIFALELKDYRVQNISLILSAFISVSGEKQHSDFNTVAISISEKYKKVDEHMRAILNKTVTLHLVANP